MKTHKHRSFAVIGSILAGGYVLSSGCTVSDVQTVVSGIDAVAGVISNLDNQNQDVSFRDWVASQLN